MRSKRKYKAEEMVRVSVTFPKSLFDAMYGAHYDDGFVTVNDFIRRAVIDKLGWRSDKEE